MDYLYKETVNHLLVDLHLKHLLLGILLTNKLFYLVNPTQDLEFPMMDSKCQCHLEDKQQQQLQVLIQVQILQAQSKFRYYKH